MTDIISSVDGPAIDWPDLPQYSDTFGVKSASAFLIPRKWTPPFVAISTTMSADLIAGEPKLLRRLQSALRHTFGVKHLNDLPDLIVRSSVVGESIWDRGTYESVVVADGDDATDPMSRLSEAARKVIESAVGEQVGLLIQQYVKPAERGEFGNLLRISKTRDHWEISTTEGESSTHRTRLNSQRDKAADPERPLEVKPGLPRERLFGSLAAWLNNELLNGRRERLTCEWVTDNQQFFVVQIDQEDEDTTGTNPRQLRIEPAVQPSGASGSHLKLADVDALSEWDKLKVLKDLWEPDAAHKPTLFYAELAGLPDNPTESDLQSLASDFEQLIGRSGIVVRTSVRANVPKVMNLPRTECLAPRTAAQWCFETKKKLIELGTVENFAFVAHKFVASRASAWVKADPANPTIEIHALWGLPDALQYCPFDIWEVHVPTETATDYPEYKSDMLIPRADGGWEYARVKNDIARTNCILTSEAKDLAKRSYAIAHRLGRPCHIMWFVGCLDRSETPFNIPWYWTEAHETQPNADRSAYRVTTIGEKKDLRKFLETHISAPKQALEFRPTDLSLMRDVEFIEAVGQAALDKKLPIILAGSTLAHAYYQLRKMGCNVITPSEKRHARKRQTASFGKLVRDKIPDKIAKRQEARATKQMDGKIRQSFLVTKLLEEALEVRAATSREDKLEELADVFEVFRALAGNEGIELQEVISAADKKAEKAGGFERGLVLLETAIIGPQGDSVLSDVTMESVLGESHVEDVAALPFSFFGFMQIDQTKAIYFERLGVRLELTLKSDRIEVRLVQSLEQLDFDLYELPSGN